jgi:hypothetical protein
MTLMEEMPLGVLLDEHQQLSAYLSWRGLDPDEDWLRGETLGALCERWGLDWAELVDEITEWLREETPRRHAVWNERLYSGEE